MEDQGVALHETTSLPACQRRFRRSSEVWSGWSSGYTHRRHERLVLGPEVI